MNNSAPEFTVDQHMLDQGSNADVHQYLTFLLDNEEYGVDILRVQEIRGWSKVTRIPNMPAYIRGVLNLRGSVVPVIDLRLRFGLPPLEYGPTTVVVVLRVQGETVSRDMGVVVDGVSEVYGIPGSQIRQTPDFGNRLKAEFIRGLATLEEQMVILLEIDSLLNSSELALMDAAARSSGED